MGLHFDLTVFLRDTPIENANELDFLPPLLDSEGGRRRTPAGRFRELTQAGISMSFGQELSSTTRSIFLLRPEALMSLPIPPVHVLVNNRMLF